MQGLRVAVSLNYGMFNLFTITKLSLLEWGIKAI